ncbi:hypothetical protein [Microcoleus sp. AR_TQ3_B6]|uniref:hypothetical protein n=1 Tax=Microcoleus sp. AR_TQ3_B6 TaxID=3055284 RepID=UPI002FD0A8B2
MQEIGNEKAGFRSSSGFNARWILQSGPCRLCLSSSGFNRRVRAAICPRRLCLYISGFNRRVRSAICYVRSHFPPV